VHHDSGFHHVVGIVAGRNVHEMEKRGKGGSSGRHEEERKSNLSGDQCVAPSASDVAGNAAPRGLDSADQISS